MPETSDHPATAPDVSAPIGKIAGAVHASRGMLELRIDPTSPVHDPAFANGTQFIFYCGTGWRSSIAFLVACLLGLPAKNYEDGFYGWSDCATNAIQRSATVRASVS